MADRIAIAALTKPALSALMSGITCYNAINSCFCSYKVCFLKRIFYYIDVESKSIPKTSIHSVVVTQTNRVKYS